MACSPEAFSFFSQKQNISRTFQLIDEFESFELELVKRVLNKLEKTLIEHFEDNPNWRVKHYETRGNLGLGVRPSGESSEFSDKMWVGVSWSEKDLSDRPWLGLRIFEDLPENVLSQFHNLPKETFGIPTEAETKWPIWGYCDWPEVTTADGYFCLIQDYEKLTSMLVKKIGFWSKIIGECLPQTAVPSFWKR